MILAFIVLGGGTAMAAFVVSSNSQIGPGTVSGHKPPSGDHANIIQSSVGSQDLAKGAVTPAKLNTPATFTSAGLADHAGDRHCRRALGGHLGAVPWGRCVRALHETRVGENL